jgi:cell division protease FtsH
LPNADPVHRISIIPRGYAALGYTLNLPAEDKYLVSKSELLDNITTLLGGRAAEELVFGDFTSGAANDIERATEIARKMVCEYGMSESFGPLAWGKTEQEVFLGKELTRIRNYSEDVAKLIDHEIQKIVMSCYERAKQILEKNRTKMDQIVAVLLEREIMSGEELRAMLNGNEESENPKDEVAAN